MTTASGHGADVVVVGGGIGGLCITYFLARAGVDVTLVEKGFLGSGASSANEGLVNVSQKRPAHYTLFSLLSADMYPEFVTELDEDVDYQRDGYLRVAETESDVPALIQRAQTERLGLGVKARNLRTRTPRRPEPALYP